MISIGLIVKQDKVIISLLILGDETKHTNKKGKNQQKRNCSKLRDNEKCSFHLPKAIAKLPKWRKTTENKSDTPLKTLATLPVVMNLHQDAGRS